MAYRIALGRIITSATVSFSSVLDYSAGSEVTVNDILRYNYSHRYSHIMTLYTA